MWPVVFDPMRHVDSDPMWPVVFDPMRHVDSDDPGWAR